jgi:putative ABC transport system substrate-binding protein
MIQELFGRTLTHPGGNITGFTNVEPTLGAKWLELLKEIAPSVTRVAIMFNPQTAPNAALFSRSAELAAQKFRVEAVVAPVHEPAEIQAVMTALGRDPGGGLILPPDAFTSTHSKLIVETAGRNGLATISPFRFFAAAGGLVSYGANVLNQFRQAAEYVDRIFRGAKTAELPVQQPTKFEFVINLKVAKALGLTVPAKLLAIADEVIE